MGYSKNQKAAKDFMRWIHSKAIYDQWFVSQQGFSVGATTDWEKHPLWKNRPDHAAVPLGVREIGRFAGYAGPPGRKAAEVVTKYSSRTCMPRRCRACRPRTPSNGHMTSW